MIHSLAIIMTVSSIMLIRSGTEESLEKKAGTVDPAEKEGSGSVPENPVGLHRFCYESSRKKSGRKLSVYGYKLCQKIYGFN